jgi:hypothetical protein
MNAPTQVKEYVKKMFDSWGEEYDEYTAYCISKNIKKIEAKEVNRMMEFHQFLYSL